MKSLLFIALASYAGLCILLYVMQDRLIFFAQPEHVGQIMLPPGWTSDPVRFRSHDGLELRGQLVRPPGDPAPLILYFGGNAEEISYLAQFADRYGRFALLLVNYRGYGGNPGTPSEKALIADAIAIHDQATATLAGIRKDQVFLHGRSLGTGIAVALASKRATRGVVLTTPYDSLLALAVASHPYVPVRWLLRHRFESLAHASSATSPALFLVGARDTIIPPSHAKTLFDAWTGPKQWREFAASGHNDIQEAAGYWDTIAAFLAAASASPAASPIPK
jgi:pimeloyl-ACP methyl ester carboxylesterase